MKLSEEKERLKYLLKDTITLLCKNGLSHKGSFSVEALIGITLGEDNVFLLNINETIGNPKQKECDKTDSSSSEENDTSDDARVNAKSRKRRQSGESNVNKSNLGSPPKKSCPNERVTKGKDTTKTDLTYSSINIKQEKNDDLVFIKEERETFDGQNVLNSETVGTDSIPQINSVHGSLPSIATWSLPGSQSYQTLPSNMNHPYLTGVTTNTQQDNTSALQSPSNTSQSQVLPLVCNICSKVYYKKQSLKAHLTGVHGLGRKRTCICGKSFPYATTYYRHKKKECPFKNNDNHLINSPQF